MARRLYRKQVVDGVYRLDAGAALDEFFRVLQELGVLDRLSQVWGTATKREMVPHVRHVLLYGLRTLFGIERMHALPILLLSDEALMQLVGFNAYQVCRGVCQRGAAPRQGRRGAAPICAETLAKNLVKLNLRDLEVLFVGAIRALAQTGVFGTKVIGMINGPGLETAQRYTGCGQVTRKVRLQDKRGRMHEIDVPVDGWKLIGLIDARAKIPLAAKAVKIQEREVLSTQAQANLAGCACLDKVIFDKGFLDGTDVWWLDQHGITSDHANPVGLGRDDAGLPQAMAHRLCRSFAPVHASHEPHAPGRRAHSLSAG